MNKGNGSSSRRPGTGGSFRAAVINGHPDGTSTTSSTSTSTVTLSTTLASNSNDSSEDNKYRKKKRLRNQMQPYMNIRNYTLVFLLVCIGIVLGRWIANSLSSRRHMSALDRKARAEALWKKIRFDDAPHAAKNGEEQGEDEEGSLLKSVSTRRLERMFEQQRNSFRGRAGGSISDILRSWLDQVDADIVNNVAGGTRWIRPYLLPSIAGDDDATQPRRITERDDKPRFLKVKRLHKQSTTKMQWEQEFEEMMAEKGGIEHVPGPIVDYTNPEKYIYPDVVVDKVPSANEYPPLKPLKQLMLDWNQDEDYEGMIHESLFHFDYTDPQQLEMAKQFRTAEVPFKLINVPELLEANKKWTDEYVSVNFGLRSSGGGSGGSLSWLGIGENKMPQADGVAQESPNNYFAFFTPKRWDVDRMGLPPVRTNDWDYQTWAQHARYADASRLASDQPHFYWQSGVDREERYMDQSRWTFISRDLPSFSSAEETFFVFNPEEQKGIQCRFGERGVVAATHYDSGRNSVGMITGAKRYILSPPRECSKLGIFTSKKSSIYRHSLLNFAHIVHYEKGNTDGMSDDERHWLERAGQAQSVETVLKAGEVLYIPSHWFHYIVSLQKSAQCNVRSGIDHDGHPVFGNRATVEQCSG